MALPCRLMRGGSVGGQVQEGCFGGLASTQSNLETKSKGFWFFNSCRFELHFLNESTDLSKALYSKYHPRTKI